MRSKFWLRFFPLPHLVAILSVGLVLMAMMIWPDGSLTGVKQQRYVLELPATDILVPPVSLPEELLTDIEWERDTVKSGDSLSVIFNRNNLSAIDVIDIVKAAPKEALKLQLKQEIRWIRSADNRITQLHIPISALATHIIEKQADGRLAYRLQERDADYLPRFAQFEIKGSLFYDGGQAGVPTSVLYQIATIFGWDIDFALDIRNGDSLRLIYEEVFLDGEKISTGDILIAEFVNRGRKLTAVRFEDEKGNANYFTPAGLSMRKEFLRNPIDFARISSRFNLRRKHPVLNRIRAHKGTDYAAPTGTPIKATGDGRVVHAGRKGGYGNVVIIQHGQRYRTLYAHLSKFGRGVRVGRSVRQGQVIGLVGSTGLATGPHLHYEFLVDGVHRDSLRVKLPKANAISTQLKPRFQQESDRLVNWLSSYQITDDDLEQQNAAANADNEGRSG